MLCAIPGGVPVETGRSRPAWFNQNDILKGGEMKLNVKAFAVTCALVWGFGLLLITWWIILLDGPSDTIPFIGRIYRGYSLTPGGSFIGFAWALIDGAIGGAVFSWLYNRAASCLKPGDEV
ncbi:MAG: bacteriophage holin [Anaerolineales bacterium]|nr:bacteriophage holin [Anaerolineales bacterium]